jgi:hypothetical protein
VTPEDAHKRARLAALKRHHGAGPEVDQLARELRMRRATKYVRGLRDGLTLQERAQLATELLAGAGDAA